jgi:hypothetical protein
MKTEFLFGLIGMITGSIGAIISIWGMIDGRMKVVSEYYSFDRGIEVINARKFIYEMEKETVSYDPQISLIISFYHYWGMMAKRRYLPFFVFDSASGRAVVMLYEKLLPTINAHRKDNKQYAEYFEWLYNKIKKRKRKL